MNSQAINKPRVITHVWPAIPTQDGAGVKIKRTIGGSGQHSLFDPFLLLDELHSNQAEDYIAGFPEHPHRGFETVTYMLKGQMRHRDHMGNEGLIQSGDVQWMTAGRGVIHSEMPEQTSGEFHGFQLWINLPSSEKMRPAHYRALKRQEIPEVPLPKGGRIRLIAGDMLDKNGDQSATVSINAALSGIRTQPLFWDLTLSENTSVTLPLTQETLLIYVVSGEVGTEAEERVQETVTSGYLARLSEGGQVKLSSSHGAQCLLLGAKPIAEPVVSYGPFVMNSKEEINQAIEDYRIGQLAL